MVNAKSAIPKLIGAIRKKITECEDYAEDCQAETWTAFVESRAKELLKELKAKESNFENHWENELEAQLSEQDWEKYSDDVAKCIDDITKARTEFVKWIHGKQSENAPTDQGGAVGGQAKESSA